MSDNPMKDYVANFRANLPSGVTYESVVARYFFNGKRFHSEWDAERYRGYIVKFGYSVSSEIITVVKPTITGSLDAGTVATITLGTYSGGTSLSLTGTLTLDGVVVDPGDPALTYDGEFVTSNEETITVALPVAPGDVLEYTIPADTSGGAVLEWTETVSNGTSPDVTQTVSANVINETGMSLNLSIDNLILSNPQTLTLTGNNLILEAT